MPILLTTKTIAGTFKQQMSRRTKSISAQTLPISMTFLVASIKANCANNSSKKPILFTSIPQNSDHGRPTTEQPSSEMVSEAFS